MRDATPSPGDYACDYSREHRSDEPSPCSDGWSDPIPIRGHADRPKFPIGSTFPPALAEIRRFVEAVATSIQVPVDFPAMLLPAIAGAAASKALAVRLWSDAPEDPVLWCVALGESGERKSAVMRTMIRPFYLWEHDEEERLRPSIAESDSRLRVLKERLTEAERKAARGTGDNALKESEEAERLAAEIASAQPITPPHLVSTEPTPEALAVIMQSNGERAIIAHAESDAFEVMMGRYSKGVANMGIYLAGHAGDAIRIGRAGKPPIALDHPALSIALIVQPEAVRDILSDPRTRGKGLLARILWTWPGSLVGFRSTTDTPVPRTLVETYGRVIRTMLDWPRESGSSPAVVGLTPEADRLFVHFREAVERDMRPGGTLYEAKDFGGKLPGAIGRLALVLHAMELALDGWDGTTSPPDIGPLTMKAAIGWAEFVIRHEQIVRAEVGASREVVVADRILDWLSRSARNQDEFSRADLYKERRSHLVRKPADLNDSLALLVEHGFIRPCSPQESGDKRGRHGSPRFEVNPKWNREGPR